MPFDPDAYLANKPQPGEAPPAAFDPDAYLANKPQPSTAPDTGPGLMSQVGSAAKLIGSSVMADLPRIAGETPESRQFESALSGVMEGGMSPDEAAQMAPVPPTQPEHGPFARGLVSTVAKQNPESAATFLEGFSNDAPEAYRPAMLSAANKIRDFSKDITPESYKRLNELMYDIKGLGDAWNWLAETSGSMLGSSIPPAIGGVIGKAVGSIAGPIGGKVGEIAGVSSASYVQNYDEVYNALRDAGLEPKVAHDYAKWGTIPIAAMDTGSIEYFLSRFGGGQAAKKAAIDSFVKRVLKEGAKVGGVEAGTEAGQEAVKDALVSMSPADKPFFTAENLKGILESGVAGLVGGAPFGGLAGVVHRAPAAPTEGDITAAGAGIVQPPGAPPTPPPAPTPPAPTAPPPTQGQLPLGPPTAQLGLPLGPPVETQAQLGARLAAMIEPVSNSVVTPSPSPLIDRGRSIVDAAASPLIASGPLQTNPQPIIVSKQALADQSERNAVSPDEKVALPAIEYNGILFPGMLHMQAVGEAMQKLGLTENQIIDSPTFKEGFVTTEGRFISREEAAHVAERHNQAQEAGGVGPGVGCLRRILMYSKRRERIERRSRRLISRKRHRG